MLKALAAEILGLLFFLFNSFINHTTRLKIINAEVLDKIHREGKQIIFASWHGRFFPAIYYFRDKKICLLPIASFRGQIIAGYARRFGYKVIRYPEFGTPGEKIQSIQKLLECFKEGCDLALMVDGPPKPEYHKVNPGVTFFSQKTGFPIVAVGVYMKNKVTLSWRWDKYEIPLPGSDVVLAFDEPEGQTAELKERLDKISEKAQTNN